MSENVEDISTEPNQVRSVVPKKRPRKVFKFRFMTSANLKNVRRDQVLAYIMLLHRKIRLLLKKSRRYREKIFKLERQNKESFDKSTDVKDAKDAKDSKDVKAKEPSDAESKSVDFIADIKDAAQQAQQISGFIYEPTSGLYYDSRTGYYYNAEHGLYYDGNSGCYYSYNQAENKFEFHSQVYTANDQTTATKEQDEEIVTKSKRKRRRKLSDRMRSKNDLRKRKTVRSESDLEKEDGELSDEDEEDSDSYDDDHQTYPNRSNIRDRRKTSIIEIDDDSNSSSETTRESYSDIAKKYPPSLRIIVQETDMKRLKIGELFLITYKGGSLGREGKHDVIIPDINCSKYHLKFEYDMEKRLYFCTDVGSRNGTIMNGKRMSKTKENSKAQRLDHGTYLQIGQTKLLCHIHDGHTTCGQCEPGLVYNDNYDSSNVNETVQHKSVHGDVNADHRRQLKNLKKRYGLQDEKYTAPKMDAKNDRAEQRRQKVGSSCDHEKTKSASLNTSISNENKGFKMLKSLGWSEGQALGKNEDGLLEPIPLQGNQNSKGLGCGGSLGSTSFVNNPKQKHKSKILEKTHRRYHESNQKSVDIFKDASDDSD